MYGYLLFDGERVPKEFNADLTPAEREIVQQRVEKLHRAWTKDRDYLAPPDAGALASLDPALISDSPEKEARTEIRAHKRLEGRYRQLIR